MILSLAIISVMDFYDITNNAIASGATQPIGKKKEKTDNTNKAKSSGSAFVSKLREAIETEIRAEYESRLAEIFTNGQFPSPPPVLSRKEYVAKQIEIIEKQYKRLLCLCDNSPELSVPFTDMPIAKRLYEQ